MTPIITVITVCYNCAQTIERTIKSVLSQSYPLVEYIIVDGNSNDGTVDVIRKYEQSISFWLSEPDKGIYDAMNKGIDAATGELIGFINADDFYADGAIEAIAKRYIETNADVIYGDLTFVDDNGPQTDWKAQEDLKDFYCGMLIPHPSTFCKAKLLKKYKMDVGYKIAGDYKLLLQLYHDKMKFVHVDKVVSFFYTGGISNCRIYRAAKETYAVSVSFVKNDLVLKEKYLDKIEKAYRGKILNMIFARACKYGYMHRWAKEQCDSGYQFYIFGAGQRAEGMYEMFFKKNISISGFLDNNEKIHGRKIQGIEIISPKVLRTASKAIVAISTVKYEKEILNQLEKMNLGDKFVFCTGNQLRHKIVRDYLRERKLFNGLH